MSERNRFTSHMLQEIREQPAAVMRTALSFDAPGPNSSAFEGAHEVAAILPGIQRIVLAASGTSRHAGMAGAFMLETLTELPARVEYASEFQYAPGRLGTGTLVIVITQSGETADTLASLRKAKAEGATVVAVANVADSSIMREAHARLQTHAGPEVAIPSTKSFTAQIAALFAFSVWIAEQTGRLSAGEARLRMAELLTVPEKLASVLRMEELSLEISRKYLRVSDFLFGGRGIHFPIAMDGALKLKEVAYVHAEGYPLGEVRHGPLAMIDESMAAVVLLTCDHGSPEATLRYEKSLAAAKEIKDRGARIIAVANEGDRQAAELGDDILFVPSAPDLLSPILEIVPLQFLALHIATLLGNDVDRPRSLVKSVLSD